MLAILWFLFVASTIATSLVWLLDHNGVVLITWLGYEVKTDILTAALLSILITLLIFAFSYLLARILAIRFPNLLKFFFRKNYLKRLERLVHRHHQAFETMTQMMLALEVSDEKTAENLQKKFSRLVKNPSLNNFFLGKIYFEKSEFARSAEYFAKFPDNKHARILVLRSKFKSSLQNNDEVAAIAYAQQILSVKRDHIDIAKTLFALYKKRGMWQEAKGLIKEYGTERFSEELQKRDLAVINTALALEAYQQKKFLLAIKHANVALKAENNFLPAIEVMLKSWLKLGFTFKVSRRIKALWRENPHLVFAEIFDLINRKSSAKKRIKAMKGLVELNSETDALNKMALGLTAYRAGSYHAAKDFLNLSLLSHKTYRAYRLQAFVSKVLGDKDGFEKNINKAEMLSKEDHYVCNSCNHLSSKWSARCNACGTYDSLEWNS